MANKETSPTKRIPENIDVPAIEVSEEEASGGTKEGVKKGVLQCISDKLGLSKSKRSKSKSPETSKEATQMEGKSSKCRKQSTSPLKLGRSVLENLFAPKGGKGCDDQEMENLCEGEVTEDPETPPSKPEKDVGIGSPSPAAELDADKVVSYNKSSSVSSDISCLSDLSPERSETSISDPFSTKDDGEQK